MHTRRNPDGAYTPDELFQRILFALRGMGEGAVVQWAVSRKALLLPVVEAELRRVGKLIGGTPEVGAWAVALADLEEAAGDLRDRPRKGDTPEARALSQALDAFYAADAALLHAIGAEAYRAGGRDVKAQEVLKDVESARILAAGGGAVGGGAPRGGRPGEYLEHAEGFKLVPVLADERWGTAQSPWAALRQARSLGMFRGATDLDVPVFDATTRGMTTLGVWHERVPMSSRERDAWTRSRALVGSPEASPYAHPQGMPSSAVELPSFSFDIAPWGQVHARVVALPGRTGQAPEHRVATEVAWTGPAPGAHHRSTFDKLGSLWVGDAPPDLLTHDLQERGVPGLPPPPKNLARALTEVDEPFKRVEWIPYVWQGHVDPGPLASSARGVHELRSVEPDALRMAVRDMAARGIQKDQVYLLPATMLPDDSHRSEQWRRIIELLPDGRIVSEIQRTDGQKMVTPAIRFSAEQWAGAVPVDAFPAGRTGTKLSKLSDNYRAQGYALKRVLQHLAPGVDWRVQMGRGTSTGWFTVKAPGLRDADQPAAEAAVHALGMGGLGRAHETLGENNRILIPVALEGVARGEKAVETPAAPAPRKPPKTVEEAEKRLVVTFRQAGWTYEQGRANSYLTAPNGAFRFQLKSRNIRGQKRGRNGKGWFDDLSYGGIKDAGAQPEELLRKGDLQAEQYAGHGPASARDLMRSPAERAAVGGAHGVTVVLSHTKADGTTVKGDTRPVKAIIKAHGFRWDGSNTLWYVRGSRGKDEPVGDLDPLVADLQKAGATVRLAGDLVESGAALPVAEAAQPPEGLDPRQLDPQTYYTVASWSRAPDATWVTERSYLGHYIRDNLAADIVKSWSDSTMRQWAVFPRDQVPQATTTAPAIPAIPADEVKDLRQVFDRAMKRIRKIEEQGVLEKGDAALIDDTVRMAKDLFEAMVEAHGNAAVDATGLRGFLFNVTSAAKRTRALPSAAPERAAPRKGKKGSKATASPSFTPGTYVPLPVNLRPASGVRIKITLGDLAKQASPDQSRFGLHQVSAIQAVGRAVYGYPLSGVRTAIYLTTDGSRLIMVPCYGTDTRVLGIPLDGRGRPYVERNGEFEILSKVMVDPSTFERYGVAPASARGSSVGEPPPADLVLSERLEPDKLVFWWDLTAAEAAQSAKGIQDLIQAHGKTRHPTLTFGPGRKIHLHMDESRKSGDQVYDEDIADLPPTWQWGPLGALLAADAVFFADALLALGKAASPGDSIRLLQQGHTLDPVMGLLVGPDGTLKLITVVMPMRIE